MTTLSLDALSAAPRRTGLRAHAHEALLKLMEGRMRGVFRRMTDEELARIDIARADIPDIARRCVRGE